MRMTCAWLAAHHLGQVQSSLKILRQLGTTSAHSCKPCVQLPGSCTTQCARQAHQLQMPDARKLYGRRSSMLGSMKAQLQHSVCQEGVQAVTLQLDTYAECSCALLRLSGCMLHKSLLCAGNADRPAGCAGASWSAHEGYWWLLRCLKSTPSISTRMAISGRPSNQILIRLHAQAQHQAPVM